VTIELNPVGVTCNIRCTYCYENPVRDADGEDKKYNIEKMLEAADKTGQKFTVFGGEPLLVPLEDLEKIFQHGYNRFKSNGIQTNGTLITDRHIELFKKYNVHVGISIDGPGELNDARAVGSLENTRKMTKRSEDNIIKLINSHNNPSLIITLHKINCSDTRLNTFIDWLVYLDNIGITSARLHFLENDNADHLRLTDEQAFQAFRRISKLPLKRLRFDTFQEIKALLTGQGEYSCNWNSCDPYTTPAVHGIDGSGSLVNCQRTNKDGISWRKADSYSNIRAVALYHTPQEYGGCKGCEWFAFCKGECPGESKDWRNRTDHCGLIKMLFKSVEDELIEAGINPLSRSEGLHDMEQAIINTDHIDSPHNDITHLDTAHIDSLHDDVFRFEVPVNYSHNEHHHMDMEVHVDNIHLDSSGNPLHHMDGTTHIDGHTDIEK